MAHIDVLASRPVGIVDRRIFGSVAEARRWAAALKRPDPAIRLISCGQTGMDDWDRDVIDGLAPHIDMHGIHLYTGSADYWSNVLAPHYAERALSVAGAHRPRPVRAARRARDLRGV